ncbi:MAG: hypothetical protein L6V93_01570 [Clostridiales bacterium]|nr:MAG: hypothetical protein L6V93_01570 [Clostridiales bacterium]
MILIFLSVILLLLSGCADRKEIDDYAYVIAAGIDKADGEKNISLPFRLQTLMQLASQKAEQTV